MFHTIQTVQCCIDLMTACIVGAIAGRIAGPRAQLGAIVLYTFNPLVALFPTLIMAETLFVFMTWLGIYRLQSHSTGPGPAQPGALVATGSVFALACLCRPSLQAFLPVAALWLGWAAYQLSRQWRTAFVQMAIFTVAVSTWLVPLQAINLRRHGEFNIGPRYATVMYSMANSQLYYEVLQAKSSTEFYDRLSKLFKQYYVGGTKQRAEWLVDAAKFRNEHASEWWVMQREKLIGFWRPWLNPLIFPRWAVLTSATATIPTFLFGFLGLVSRKWSHPCRPLLVGMIVVGYLSGGILFIVSTRFRIPSVDIALMVFAGVWLAGLGQSKVAESETATDPDASRIAGNAA